MQGPRNYHVWYHGKKDGSGLATILCVPIALALTIYGTFFHEYTPPLVVDEPTKATPERDWDAYYAELEQERLAYVAESEAKDAAKEALSQCILTVNVYSGKVAAVKEQCAPELAALEDLGVQYFL